MPESVAIIGATQTPGSVGRTVAENLIRNPFGGTVFPISPNRSCIAGVKAYPDLAAVPQAVDLAVIATPAPTVPAMVGECIAAGVKGAIILSSGFGECGPAGAELERQVKEQVRHGRMRVLGPNCFGIQCPRTGLNATFGVGMPRPGNIGFISQSGSLLSAIRYWSHQDQVGCSAFLSVGSLLDVGWADLIAHLGQDPHTRSIVLYMESMGDPDSFIAAARGVAPHKPILAIKAGRTEATARAAAAHTSALAGSDAAVDEVFRRAGVLRVDTIEELFNMAAVFAEHPPALGRRLAIVTNAGGPALLAADALIEQGGELATLAPETLAALNRVLPSRWSHGNPIDIGDDAGPERFAEAVEIACNDPNSDGLLVILTPQPMSHPVQTAEQIGKLAQNSGKPILASWLWGAGDAASVATLNRAGILTSPCLRTAVKTFSYLWRHRENRRVSCEGPMSSELDVRFSSGPQVSVQPP
jgi:acetyltransferase